MVQGLFEKSDSIGYDAVFQYNALSSTYGIEQVSIYAENFDRSRYPDTPITSIDRLYESVDAGNTPHIIYHYCDGWPQFDAWIIGYTGKVSLRWHNNTPPWFYAASHPQLAERTIRGFEQIRELARAPHVDFWVNSNFTARQLEALNGPLERTSVVFPASRYLNEAEHPIIARMTSPDLPEEASANPIRLLFVSRVVAHKGHGHVIALADYLQNAHGVAVEIDFVGRGHSASTWVARLNAQADRCGITMRLNGEVSEAELTSFYRSAHAFVCLSEHEGFGLPAFEAIRCGLPVVTWARTAFTELLGQHPLSLHELDIRKAAAAILSLRDQHFRNEIVALQHELASGYARPIVKHQIENALAGRYGLHPSLSLDDRWGSFLDKARTAIADRASELHRHECRAPHMHAREYGDNYVTLHDLEVYAALSQPSTGRMKTMLRSSVRSFFRRCTAAAALAVPLFMTSACGPGFMTAAGPSTGAVMKAGNQPSLSGIQMVELNDTVARRVLATEQHHLFSTELGESAPAGTIVGPGDRVEVTLWEAPPATLFGNSIAASRLMPSSNATSLSITLPEQMVDGGGRINIPFAGSINATGRSPQQIEAEIVKRLTGKAHQPQALVRIVGNVTSTVTVVGEVGSNRLIPLSARGERLLDVLAAAGGTRQPVGKMTIQLTRGNKVAAMPLTQIIADPSQNIVLRSGDVVTALFQPYSFTVLGASGRNEELPFEASGLTLAQAFGRIGGLQDQRANAQGVFIFRFEDPAALEPESMAGARTTPNGKVAVIYRVNLRNPETFFVAQGFPIRDKDIVYVSNAPLADLQKFVAIVSSIAYPVISLQAAARN